MSNPGKLLGNSRIILKKVISKGKKLNRIALQQKLKTMVRPYYGHVKSLGVKFLYAAKLAISPNAIRLHKMISKARSTDREEDWKESVLAWQDIIEEFGKATPVEAYVRKGRALQELKDFSQAVHVLEQATKTYPRNPERVTQQDMQDLLTLSKEKAEISVAMRLNNISQYKSSIKNYKNKIKKRSTKDPKIAIVSAVSNGYDVFRPPAIIDPRVDYIVYSDKTVFNPGLYDVRPLPYIDFDGTRSARFVKTNVHKLLPGYDYVMWVDANIMITGDIYPIIENFIQSQKEFGAMLHPMRTSLYEEMAVCLRAGKDDVDAINEQKEFYEAQGYRSDKLIESNVLLYSLKSPNLEKFLNEWWSQIDRFSRRDQLSINYCLDINNVDWSTIMKKPNTARNHPDFALVDHGQGNGKLRRLIRLLDSDAVDPFTQPRSDQIVTDKIRTVTAVVCVHNAHDEVKKCLSSIKKHKAENLDLVIVDDGSETKTKKLLASFTSNNSSWTKLIRHNTAQGYTRAATVGLKASKADLTILLNSDTIVTKNWSKKMARALETSAGTGIVGPMSSAASHQSVPNHLSSVDQTAINVLPKGVTIEQMNSYCEKWAKDTTFPRVPLVHGFCLGIRREVLDKIGYFDYDHFPRGYGEENDYCFRAANAGFGLVIATDTYVFHAKSKSFVSTERKKLMQEGGKAFRNLHGQRRITRAVKMMENNPYLQTMRNYANDLYVKKEIRSNDVESAVFLPKTVSTLRGLSYEDLSQTLIYLNDAMIDWHKLQSQYRTSKQSVKVSIIVLVLNHLEITERCINSIFEHTNSKDYELIVVNNGSNLETLFGLRKIKDRYPQIKLVNIEQNTNFALGNNLGFSFARGKYVVFLNNDTYVTPGWLGALIKPLEETIADITQPLLLYPEGDVQNAGVVFSRRSPFGYALYSGQSPDALNIVKSRHLHAVTGACMALKSTFFADMEGFDASYVNGQEDVDLCLRLEKAKAKAYKGAYLAADSVVYHDESRTPGRGTHKYRNRAVFASRWKLPSRAYDQYNYEADGYEVVEWLADSVEATELGVPVYSPKLRKRQ